MTAGAYEKFPGKFYDAGGAMFNASHLDYATVQEAVTAAEAEDGVVWIDPSAADADSYSYPAGANIVVLDFRTPGVFSVKSSTMIFSATTISLVADQINLITPNVIVNATVDKGLYPLQVAGTGTTGGAANVLLWRNDATIAASEGLGSIYFGGDEGSDFDTGGAIHFYAAENWGAAAKGTYMTISTTPVGTTTALDRIRITSEGMVLINEVSNAKMTIGLTIHQGADTDEILAFKNSQVTHGMTSNVETDTYFAVQMFNSAGGVHLGGWSESVVGLRLRGNATVDDANKNTGAKAYVMVDAQKKSGTTTGAVGADANIVAFQAAGTTRFILDEDGDSHQDVGTAWTNFDEFDDPKLLRDLSVAVSRLGDPIREGFGELIRYNRAALEKAKLVTFNEDGHHFVNMSKLTMLLTGAICQLQERLQTMEQRMLLNP